MKFADTPESRLAQCNELLWNHIIDTRDAAILMGVSPEYAPPAGIYVDRPRCWDDVVWDDSDDPLSWPREVDE